MQSANPKLYLILESCDSGGYNILKVRNTIDECVEWLDQNPENIPYGIVARVTGCGEPEYFEVVPVTYVATKWMQGKNIIVTSAMDHAAMTQWLHELGSTKPYHLVADHGPRINMWMAETKADTEKICGKFESVVAVPRSCRISEEQCK